jgi:hypothetical protein
VVGLQGDTSSSLFDDVEDDPVNNALEAGVYGYGSTGDYPNGVYGESDALFGTGVFGEGGYGVLGFGWVGVVGVAFAGEGAGVHGHGGSGSWPDSPSNTGVFATCASGGVALDVRGKARFSRSKRVLIAKGKSSLKVSLAEVSASSLVFAVLQGNRAGTYVRAVVPAAGSFTIYLNNAVTASTYVAYFVLN